MNKFKLYIPLLLLLSYSNLFSMAAGGSRRYRDFMQELNKATPNSSTLSDWYYELENTDEQQKVLKAATEKNIMLAGQQDEQKKIKAQILKTIKEERERRSPSPTKHERKPSQDLKLSLQDFEGKLKSGIRVEAAERFFNQLNSADKDAGLGLASYYGYTIAGFKNKQRAHDKSEISDIQNNIVIIEAQIDKLKKENINLKNVLNDLLLLAEQSQNIKEDIVKLEKQIKNNNSTIDKLKTSSNVKSAQTAGLIKNQNKQLKEQNNNLKEELAKIQKQLESLKNK